MTPTSPVPVPPPSPSALVKVTVRLPQDLVLRAKHYALDHALDLQELIALTLAKHLEADLIRTGRRNASPASAGRRPRRTGGR